jgi:hypothetical protein
LALKLPRKKYKCIYLTPSRYPEITPIFLIITDPKRDSNLLEKSGRGIGIYKVPRALSFWRKLAE